MTTPIALTIAGSDSSGGAGIQADLKTFAAFGVYGASVITALTAQNTSGVSGIHQVPAEFVSAQIDAVFWVRSRSAWWRIRRLSMPSSPGSIAGRRNTSCSIP
jgi:hydroxymethylpyrimidine/phosphomethylpyrimidine kinase